VPEKDDEKVTDDGKVSGLREGQISCPPETTAAATTTEGTTEDTTEDTTEGTTEG
jgi:hypothetical protein